MVGDVEGMIGDAELSALLPTGSGLHLFVHLEFVLKNVLIGVFDAEAFIKENEDLTINLQ